MFHVKILFLTSRLPYPPFRGDKLKIWNLLRKVAGTHEVALLSFVQRPSEETYRSSLAPFCKRIDLIRLPLASSLWECVKAIPLRIPWQVAFFHSKEMERTLEQVVQEWKPDIIHTHLIRMAPYTATRYGTMSVLDMTDAVSLYLQRFLETERNPVKRALLSLEYRRMIKFEPIIGSFASSLVCSPIDREALKANVPRAKIELLYNGVDVDLFSKQHISELNPGRIIYTGNMSYFPNVDGAEYLVRQIFPRILAAIPAAKLYIVGQNPPKRVLDLASDKVIVTGFVPDIRAEYAKSVVAVSPIRFGAGTLNKILEPLAMGIPVVSTSEGAIGMELDAGRDYLVANSPQEFADHVIRLMTDKDYRSQMGIEATEKVRSRFNWDRVARTLLDIYAGVAAQAQVRKTSHVV